MLDNYKDIITEIELSKIRIEGLEEEQKSISKIMFSSMPGDIRGMSYDGMPGGSKNDTPLDKLWERMLRIDSAITVEQNRIEILEKTRNKMDRKIDEIDGLKYKIGYLQLQGYTLEEIADKVNYSKSYVEKISAKIKVKEKCNQSIANM